MGRKRKILKPDDGDKHLFLPPCRVCEGPAGGFHYGVNTCEACKGFFHRSSSGKEELKCDSGGNCSVLYTVPRICKKCRYAKCISVGMAKGAIKTGRYTVEKRTKDILEVKSLEGKNSGLEKNFKETQGRNSDSESNKSHKSFSEGSREDSQSLKHTYSGLNSTTSTSTSNNQATSSNVEHFLCSTSHTSTIDSSPGHNLSPESHFDHLSPTMSNTSSASPSPFMVAAPSKLCSSTSGCDSNLSPDSCLSPPRPSVVSQCPCSQTIFDLYKDMDKVTSLLAQAREDHIKDLLPNKSKEEMQKMAAEHIEMCHLRREMFGTMSRLPDQEYDSIYASTGLDADGRMQRYEDYNTQMEIYIRAYAKFAKCVPGFSHLDIQDQVTLIKYSRNEFLLFMGFNEVTQGAIYCADKKMRCKSCVDIAGNRDFEDLMDRFVHYCEAYQNLQLSQEEKVLMGALVLMAPDREISINSKTAKLIYELLNDCIIHLFRKRFSKPLQMYAKVVSVLVGIRSFNFESSKFIRALRFDKYSSALHNPLLREMFGGIYFDDFEAPEMEVPNYDANAMKNL